MAEFFKTTFFGGGTLGAENTGLNIWLFVCNSLSRLRIHSFMECNERYSLFCLRTAHQELRSAWKQRGLCLKKYGIAFPWIFNDCFVTLTGESEKGTTSELLSRLFPSSLFEDRQYPLPRAFLSQQGGLEQTRLSWASLFTKEVSWGVRITSMGVSLHSEIGKGLGLWFAVFLNSKKKSRGDTTPQHNHGYNQGLDWKPFRAQKPRQFPIRRPSIPDFLLYVRYPQFSSRISDGEVLNTVDRIFP